jgi:hypothetical protein
VTLQRVYLCAVMMMVPEQSAEQGLLVLRLGVLREREPEH